MWTNNAEKDWVLKHLAEADALETKISRIVVQALEKYTVTWQSAQSHQTEERAAHFNATESGDPFTAETRVQRQIEEDLWQEYSALRVVRRLINEQQILSPSVQTYTEAKAGAWIKAKKAKKIFDTFSSSEQIEAKRGLLSVQREKEAHKSTLSLSDVVSNIKHTELASTAQVRWHAVVATERAELQAENMFHQLIGKYPTMLGIVHESLRVRRAIADSYPSAR